MDRISTSPSTPKKINKYEYGYLKGDKEMWPHGGAAFNVVYEWCKSNGYGTFGEPTALGKRVMDEYDLQHTPINYQDV